MDSEQKRIPYEELDETERSQSAQKKITETKNKDEKLSVLQSLVRLEAPWAQESLLNALADPSEEIRHFIVTQLAQKENIDLNMLYNRLSKPPWNIKIEVLKILGMRKNQRSAKHIEAVIHETNTEVRRTAAVVLGEIGGDFARSLLVKLAKDPNPFVRKIAEKSLEKTTDLKFL